ncbi:MAG TPA: isocitrate/isopropylmalate dehydrogenase family protein [Anaerolineae bacterium]|nr:isocitrate/isopropylmalate dehydrogenase family protein [Anaerolineae bacterium]
MKSAICLVPGDGVGQEVIPATAEVLAALGLGLNFVEARAGFEHFQRTGNAIPDETLADVAAAGAALFGATASPSTTVEGYRSPILVMRRTFDLYANLRPAASLPGSFSRPNINLLIVRENTEGLYAGRERREDEAAIAERLITRKASERIARVAFEQARKRMADGGASNQHSAFSNPTPLCFGDCRHQSSVTIVHKANVLKLTDGLFREACFKVAAEFPEVQVNEMLVDAMAMRLVRDPESFDVIVTTNLFGDILSDEAAGLIGGLGVAPSANLGERVAVFEPVHGSAPDIAGQGIANPIGAILSAALLLDHIGQPAAAERVRQSINATLAQGMLPRDLGGTATTADVTRATIKNL